jgi:hypothetical protein
MTSMLHSARSSQADADDTEVILGVDAHKDTHVAAVLNPVVCCWTAAGLAPPPLATSSCSAGCRRSGHRGGPGWRAPAPTGRR